MIALAVVALAICGNDPTTSAAQHWQPFQFLISPHYGLMEKGGLLVSLLIAIGGLIYAFQLAKQVYSAESGNSAMKAVALAVREGADAYLFKQFRVVGILLVLMTVAIVAAKWPWQLGEDHASRAERIAVTVGRGIAFLMGSIFSASVGFNL